MIEDKPWFVAVDVCRCLDIHIMPSGEVNVNNATRKLGDDESALYLMEGEGRWGLQMKTYRCVSESGLYKFVLRSDKLVARRFQDWLTREVLPALRKDGMYVMGEEKVKTGEMSHHLPRKPAGYEVIFTRH